MRRGRLSAAGPPVLAVACYLAIAMLAFFPVEPFSRSRILGCACSDPVQETWFLAWTAHALIHGVNPFFTTRLEYPGGVNLALNTSMPLLGFLAAPVTLAASPISAFNALMRLSFALSATSMLFVVRRFTSWWPAAMLGGLLYGFSPYMVGQGYGHLFLTFVPLPPLIALCVYEICTRRDGSALKAGLLLGALCVLQYLISVEVLATTVICCLAVIVLAALRHPLGAREVAPRVLRAGAAGLAVAVPLLAYPVWFFLRGPRHVVGPPHSVANLAPIKADLLGPIIPTLNQRIGPAHLISIGTSFGAGDRPENGVYLGIPLLVLLLVLVVRFRREALVVLGSLIGLVGFVLALGASLMVDKHPTGLRLPFDLLVHLPLLKGIEAERFTLYEQLGAAVVLGVGLDRLRGSSPLRRFVRPAVVGLVGAAALVPLLPRYPYPSPPAHVPAYFTSGASAAIPSGSVVLTYPYDIDPANEAMLWQATSDMRFAIFGGQASIPGPGGAATSAVPVLPPPTLQQLLRATMNGEAPLPPLDAATLKAIRQFLVSYDVGTVVAVHRGQRPGLAAAYLAAALGRGPQVTGGVKVWYGVAATARHLLRTG